MEQSKKTENKIVQTYAEDMAKVIESDKEGLVKKIIHGEEQHELEKKNLSPMSKQNKILMFLSILLIVLALITLSFFFFRKDINMVEVEKQFVPIIFNDQSVYLEVFGLKKDEIVQTILNQVNTTEVKLGGLEGIYLTENKQIVGLRRFLFLIKSNFIPGDNTLFVNDNFLIGVVNAETKDFFILIKVRSTADIFDSLRAWEGKMLADLQGFLDITMNSDTYYLLNKEFQNDIVENKNSRILYDKDNNIILMYIFADDNSVIITDSKTAAHEVMLRLASSRTKQ